MTIVNFPHSGGREVDGLQLPANLRRRERREKRLVKELFQKWGFIRRMATHEHASLTQRRWTTQVLNHDGTTTSSETFHLSPKRQRIVQVMEETIGHDKIEGRTNAT